MPPIQLGKKIYINIFFQVKNGNVVNRASTILGVPMATTKLM